jgi:hypothetical protein
MLYGIENKTNSYSNEIYLFVISPIIDIQTSPNTTLPLNFSSVGVYLEPYFNSSSAGKIFVEEVNITIPTSLAKLKSIRVELEENLRNILGWSILRLYYNPNVVSSQHINENSLAIYYYNENVGAWEKISSSINKMDHYVEANVTHFSTYGLLGEISPYCGDGVCNNGETYSSCPQDCPAPAPSVGGTPAGGAPLVSAVCEENWTCSSWSECYPNGTQYRACRDLNNCNTTKNKPAEEQACTYTPATTSTTTTTVPTTTTTLPPSTGITGFFAFITSPITIVGIVIIIVGIVGIFLLKRVGWLKPKL